MKLITLMINNEHDVPIDGMRILTSRFDFVIYKFSVEQEETVIICQKTRQGRIVNKPRHSQDFFY